MIEIRALDLQDHETLHALVALQRASYAVEARLIGTDALPPLRETPEQLAASGEAFLGAFAPELAGAISFKRPRHGTVDIHRLVVHPDHFRRGIASALLNALPAARRVTVATSVLNAPAVALYERHGFRAVGERVVAPGVTIVDFERRHAARR